MSSLPGSTRKNTHGPVIILDDGDAAGEKTLRLGIQIAQATNEQLSLLALASNKEQMNFISERALDMIPSGQKMTLHRLVPGTIEALKATFSLLSPSFIVADMHGEPFGDDKTAQTLLRTASAPIILLRS